MSKLRSLLDGTVLCQVGLLAKSYLGLVSQVASGSKYVAHLPDGRQLSMRGPSLGGMVVRHAFMLQLLQQASLAHAWLPLNHHDPPLTSVH